MKANWTRIFGWGLAGVLLIVGIILTVLGNNVSSAGEWASGWFAAGNFSSGVFSAGIFSIGVFSVGIFSIGIFSLGIFSIGLFNMAIFGLGLYCVHIPEQTGHHSGRNRPPYRSKSATPARQAGG